jgi:dimethylargininase
VRREFDAYVAALEGAGVAVETLPPLDEFPDSIFLEDPALVFPEGAVVLRPGAPSRLGEATAIAPELGRRFERVLELDDGFVEGGDILTTPREVLIGLSARTDERGARALLVLLEQLGRRGRTSRPTARFSTKRPCCALSGLRHPASSTTTASSSRPEARRRQRTLYA